MVRTASETSLAFDAAQKVVEAHRRISASLRVGQTLAQIDTTVAKTLADLGCRSCFLGYKIPKSPAFPSHACLSVNACVVHGTAGYYTQPMKLGDILKIDIGVTHKGWIGDAAWTYSFGEPDPLARRLMECGKESLRRGIRELRPGRPLIEWAKAVEGHVEKECKFHLIRGLGGHGIGLNTLHGPPFVSNSTPTFPGEWSDAYKKCEPGLLVAVEPMLAIGTGQTTHKRSEWPVFTADGSLAVHYEHDVLVTPEGPRIMSEGMDELPDVVGV